MRKFVIIGLGLIGGSIAKVLKSKIACEITAIDTNIDSLQTAVADGIIDSFNSFVTNAVVGAEIIFICTNVASITPYIHSLSQYVDSKCIITDVGSTKLSIMNEAAKISGITFIGGHPMTGSEKIGYAASKDILFQNAYYILTPFENVPGVTVDKMIEIINVLGGLPIVMDAKTHDLVVSVISHTPHVIAAALVNTVKGFSSHIDDGYVERLAAGGFKDITRIASSSPVMWSDISLENKKNVLSVIRSFKETLNTFEQYLNDFDREELISYFANAKQYRDGFVLSGAINSPAVEHRLLIDVYDRPGMIASVATLLSENNINIKNIGIINNREFTGGVMHILFDSAESVQKGKEILESAFEGVKIWI